MGKYERALQSISYSFVQNEQCKIKYFILINADAGLYQRF